MSKGYDFPLWDSVVEKYGIKPDLDLIELIYTKSEIKEMLLDFSSTLTEASFTSEEWHFLDGLNEWYRNL